MQWGASLLRAEITPKEPDPDNAGEGRAKGKFPTPLVKFFNQIFQK